MITAVTLKRNNSRRGAPQRMAEPDYSFRVQSGFLAIREQKTGRVFSVPLSDVLLTDGCVGAAPPAREEA